MDVHRGIAVALHDDDHAVVHDQSRPLGERAEHLMDAVTKEGHEPLGQHWTTERHWADHFSHQYGGYGQHGTQVVFHATHPEHHEIEHDEGWRAEHEVNDDEAEVPVKRGSDMEVHSVSWRRHNPPGTPEHSWNHHHFGDDPQYHEARRKRAGGGFRPHKRIFGPTYGLDHRLFEGERLKNDVRDYILNTLDLFWKPRYGGDWAKWAKVYFAGSEASEWTSLTREGNNDFDVLIGIDYDAFREHIGVSTSSEEITEHMNQEFKDELDHVTAEASIVVDGIPEGPFENTWYVNINSDPDIRKIRPYAAYDVTADEWAVKPPHLPDWSLAQFPEGAALERLAESVSGAVRAVLELPEPYRTQQAAAWWDHLHGDRSRAFTPQGEGWYDPSNVIEKWLDQEGLWAQLWEAKHRAEVDPHAMDAPSDWSNDPLAKAVRASRLLRSGR